MNHKTEERLKCQELEVTSPVSLSLKLTNAETRILAQGSAQAKVKVECARCSEEFSLPLEIEIDENFVKEDSSEARVKTADQFEILTYKEDRIELDEMLRQNFLAAVPMQPICQEGRCQGLCDQCGANLNNTSCDCSKEEIDPRWAGLSKVKTRSSDASFN